MRGGREGPEGAVSTEENNKNQTRSTPELSN